LEDVVISNITMRDIINSPIFLRLGARLRAPAGTSVGALRRISISNVNVYNADARFATLISGVPGHAIEDVQLSNISIWYKPLDAASAGAVQAVVPEHEQDYPEPQKFGVLPAYGFFIRHVKNIALHQVTLHLLGTENRPALLLTDVQGAELHQVALPPTPAGARLVLQDVSALRVQDSNSLPTLDLKKSTTKSF
jgi:hypothetical protein